MRAGVSRSPLFVHAGVSREKCLVCKYPHGYFALIPPFPLPLVPTPWLTAKWKPEKDTIFRWWQRITRRASTAVLSDEIPCRVNNFPLRDVWIGITD